LPKILSTDTALPEGCSIGEMIKVQRKEEDNVFISYRVVI
jgi:DNA-directed RNA polymerase subunit H (RpoH/RPB5)